MEFLYEQEEKKQGIFKRFLEWAKKIIRLIKIKIKKFLRKLGIGRPGDGNNDENKISKLDAEIEEYNKKIAISKKKLSTIDSDLTSRHKKAQEIEKKYKNVVGASDKFVASRKEMIPVAVKGDKPSSAPSKEQLNAKISEYERLIKKAEATKVIVSQNRKLKKEINALSHEHMKLEEILKRYTSLLNAGNLTQEDCQKLKDDIERVKRKLDSLTNLALQKSTLIATNKAEINSVIEESYNIYEDTIILEGEKQSGFVGFIKRLIEKTKKFINFIKRKLIEFLRKIKILKAKKDDNNSKERLKDAEAQRDLKRKELNKYDSESKLKSEQIRDLDGTIAKRQNDISKIKSSTLKVGRTTSNLNKSIAKVSIRNEYDNKNNAKSHKRVSEYNDAASAINDIEKFKEKNLNDISNFLVKLKNELSKLDSKLKDLETNYKKNKEKIDSDPDLKKATTQQIADVKEKYNLVRDSYNEVVRKLH